MSSIEALIRAHCARRGPGRTICPSEVARAAGGERGDWRALMPAVRAAAAALVDQGEILATQRGRPVDPRAARGPIRLGLPALPSIAGRDVLPEDPRDEDR